MTRREKILLQICIAVGVIGMSVLYLLIPSTRAKQQAREELEAMQFNELQIMTVVETPGVEEALATQKKLADKNYQYFYGELNTYTIDGILNRLTEESGLAVQSMNIGKYIEIDGKSLQRGPEEETQEPAADASGQTGENAAPLSQEELLLGCNVTLTVTGSYGDILAFVDALEKESTCIEVSSVNLYRNERNTQQDQAIEASVGLLIYGISGNILEGEDS